MNGKLRQFYRHASPLPRLLIGLLIGVLVSLLAFAPQSITPARAQTCAPGTYDLQSPPLPQGEDCYVVATVFERKICESHLKNRSEGFFNALRTFDMSDSTDIMRLYGENRQEQMRTLFWTIALEEKFGQDALEISEEAVLSYQDAFRDTLKKRYRINKQTRDYAQQLLAENRYDPVSESRLHGLIESAETSITTYEAVHDEKQRLPEEPAATEPAPAAKMENMMAEMHIREWTIDRLLYDEYGGGLVKRGERVQPVEAYRHFISYIQREGAPQINDPSCTGILASFESRLPPEEDYLPPDEEGFYKAYFSDPAWAIKNDERQDSFAEIKALLDSIRPVTPDTGAQSE